ncbi:MAG TPA: TonB-dependent receptor [Ignavibacteriaceae bacterium]|nr:TonB-dependent receptor [Ignavibacteriaceae bacterium]
MNRIIRTSLITNIHSFLSFTSLLSIIITLLLISPVVYGGTTGKISGKVVDKETNEPIVGANIVIEGTYYGAATDLDGYYFINNVTPGRYNLKVSAIGYHKVTVENVAVRIDLTTNVDVALSSEAITLGEVVVQATQPMVTKDLTSTSAIVSSEDIKMMPVENLNQVVNLQAGVVAGHFRGGRTGEVAYLIDGIPVNDVFNGSVSVTVENNAIRQLEVISGTFNAEYGSALSGVVNIVTKEGSSKFEGYAAAYVGNYFTQHSDIFYNLNKANLDGPKDVQFNLSGPTKVLDGLTFFVNGRYYKDDGYLYGKRYFNIGDRAPIIPDQSHPQYFIIHNTGDSAFVAMNPEENKSFSGKLTYGLENWKFSYSFFWDDHTNRYYNHSYRLAPDGLMTHYRTNYVHNFQISFFPSKSTFATLKYSNNDNQYKGYLYADEYDSRYVDPNNSTPISDYTFRYGGNETDRYDRFTKSNLILFAIESQVSKEHKIKFGAEGRFHELYNHWKTIRNQTESEGTWTIGYTDVGTPYHTLYDTHPYEFAAYLQDKMEYDIMIINAGVRFDYFNSNTTLPVDIRNPLNNPLFPGAFQTRKAEAEWQISPRFGVSFPISDQGAIHFSYGHFFQLPSFENLYYNNAYNIDQTSGLNTIVGNPELKAQKTVKYELGVQQVIFPNVSLDASVYYSDIRNLLGTQILSTYEGFLFGRYINRDYGNVKGLIVTIEKRYSDFFSAKIDYTYQVARGNASDPLQNFYNNQSDPPVEETKKVVPLNWDQTSTLNVIATVGDPLDWTVGIIFSYGSGTPYTEDARYTRGLRFENNGTKPSTLNLDLKATKIFNVFGLDFNTYLMIYNLLDTKNEYGVYGSTGRAGQDLAAEEYTGTIYGLNTKQEFVLNPQNYSAPRQIRIGFGVGF